MSHHDHDCRILRELARRKQEIGLLPAQRETMQRWRRLNSLQPVRPLVWINEIPWWELIEQAPELVPQCRDPFLRGLEISLRQELYQWDHFRCDMIVEPVVFVDIVGGPRSSYADYGLEEKATQVEGAHDVVYQPVIHSEQDAERIQTPRVWYDREETARRLALAEEVFDGVIEVRPRGLTHQWHAPWDQAIHWYGVHQLLEDLYERPKLVAMVIERVCRAIAEVLDQQQALGMLDVGGNHQRVGSGGMGSSDELPGEATGRPVTPADQWGCGNAQVFCEVSPAMHEEFSLQYERPILERFGLTYYGCCEPLHHKIDMLRSVKNLRKVSMSPRADLHAAARNVGRDYVISFKPNPAQMAGDRFDEEAVERYLRDALGALKGCAVEIILKDISTVRHDPMRLDRWAAVATRVVSEVTG